MLERYGWAVATDAEGGIANLTFLGDKYTDATDELLRTLAPFVESGSFLIRAPGIIVVEV